MGIIKWIFFIITTNAAFLHTIEAKKVTLNVKGYVAAVFTPVFCNERLNLDIIPSYAQYLKDNRVQGVLVAGTTGEGTTLTVREKKRLISAWIKAAGPLNLGVILQVGGIPLPDVQELAKYAEKLRVDAILTLPDLFYKPKTTEELVYYIQKVANAAPNTPILYYNIPKFTGVYVDLGEFVELATRRVPTFKGLKSESFEDALEAMYKLEDDQRIFVASAIDLAPAALIGFTDFIMSELNLFPKLVIDIVSNSERGNVVTARTQYERFIDLVDIIDAQGSDLVAQKAAMPIISGINVGPIRPPEIRFTNDQSNTLENNLRQAGIRIIDSSVCYATDDD